MTNRNGETYTYAYDALNRVISETDSLGNTKYFGYNKNSEIVSVTDRNGNTTAYTLDGNIVLFGGFIHQWKNIKFIG